MSYILFLDDERNPENVIYKNPVLEDLDNVVVCRNLYEARTYIKEHGLPYHVSFDYILNPNNPNFQPGTKLANFLTMEAMRGNLPEDFTYYVHSEYERAYEINKIMDKAFEIRDNLNNKKSKI